MPPNAIELESIVRTATDDCRDLGLLDPAKAQAIANAAARDAAAECDSGAIILNGPARVRARIKLATAQPAKPPGHRFSLGQHEDRNEEAASSAWQHQAGGSGSRKRRRPRHRAAIATNVALPPVTAAAALERNRAATPPEPSGGFNRTRIRRPS